MKSALLVVVFFIGGNASAQQFRSAFDQLVYVNEKWKSQPDVDPSLYTTPAKKLSEQQLIQFHLQETEKLLRKREQCHLTDQAKSNRKQNLSTLSSYRKQGIFPINNQHQNRQPYFIDDNNTYCAVGYLMKESGGDAIAKDIHTTQNFSYLPDIHHPHLMDWVQTSGLTLDELALIQPGYGDRTPACVTELHYNNAGTDTNEFIELFPDQGGSATKMLDSILFFNASGVLYHSIVLAQATTFYVDGRRFIHYAFTDTFADKGIVELKGYDPMVPAYRFVLQRLTYNASSVTVENFSQFVTFPDVPSIVVFNSGESEATPPGTSLTFCGNIGDRNGFSLQSMASTPGTVSCLILPISLSSFASNIVENKVQLHWETLSESNNSHYFVERSSNGTQFTSIGKVKAVGNSSAANKYSFTDNQPQYINHYRLKQVDADGKYTYSKILYVKVPVKNGLLIRGNIVNQTLQVQVNVEASNIQNLVLYDFTGRRISTFKAKEGLQTLDISSLRSGKYLLQLAAKDGSAYNQSFIKAK